MRISTYIGKMFDINGLDGDDEYAYYPDDYDYPCYCIYIPDSRMDVFERGVSFSMNLYVDQNNKIIKIERVKDLSMCGSGTDYIVSRFPSEIENDADTLMQKLCNDKMENR